MLFNSFEFLLFLLLVFCGYWFLFKRYSRQNLFVLAVSYLFYGRWDWRFLLLIILTTLLCYFSGKAISRTPDRNRQRWICGVNIAVNIAILVFFKYANFFSENLDLLFRQFGIRLDWITLDILLPVGISFYTFQAISYPIDIYRKKLPATTDFVAFATFIAFFPQLVAGPIERSTHLLPQFLQPRRFRYDKAVNGLRQMLWGFFKKLVIADNCSLLANLVFDRYTTADPLTLWTGALLFTFQIYGDFSGYSDIAIGTARLFGIDLRQNFRYPYFSCDITEFWRRWHISLNTWFRDYIYIPLGGSRCSAAKVIRNTLVVFLISGLWHGANWTFIAWGIYHGLLFLPLVLLRKNPLHPRTADPARRLPALRKLLSMTTTFFLVTTGWILFRSQTVGDAARYLQRCFSLSDRATENLFDGNRDTLIYTFAFITLLLLTEWSQRHKEYGLQIVEGRPRPIRWGIYLLILFSILIFTGPQEQFIYFQF
ncbi:MAG: MBOAT family protein [Coprobacter sp.]|nr:MBOAT family protein [Coprobacter sp.]